MFRFSHPLAKIVLLVVLAAGLAACGESNEVGSGVDLNFEDQVNESLDSTTTVAPSTTVAPDGSEQQSGAIGKPTPTTAAPVTTAPAAQYFEVGILGDKAGQTQFDPPVSVVRAGTLIRWTNKDAKPRSVIADNGEFDSGMLAPGATFIWKSAGSGRVNYSDGTRPYAVGAVEIR